MISSLLNCIIILTVPLPYILSNRFMKSNCYLLYCIYLFTIHRLIKFTANWSLYKTDFHFITYTRFGWPRILLFSDNKLWHMNGITRVNSIEHSRKNFFYSFTYFMFYNRKLPSITHWIGGHIIKIRTRLIHKLTKHSYKQWMLLA